MRWCSPSVISAVLTGNEILTKKTSFRALTDSDSPFFIKVHGHFVKAYNLEAGAEKIKKIPDLQKYVK